MTFFRCSGSSVGKVSAFASRCAGNVTEVLALQTPFIPRSKGELVHSTLIETIHARKERLSNSEPCYRFMGADKCLEWIKRESIYISDPALFNDPFDMQIDVENQLDRSPFDNEAVLRKAFQTVFMENTRIDNFWFYDADFISSLRDWASGFAHHRNVIDAFKKRVSAFGVTCFTPDWNVPLMWSHYAASHTGVCVEWAIAPMAFARAESNLHLAQYPVSYTTQLPTICLSELLFAPHQVLPNFLATKHADWAYEKEWRLVNFEGKAKNIAMPAHMQISALILGLNFDSTKLGAMAEKARQLDVPLYQISRPYGYDFKLKPV